MPPISVTRPTPLASCDSVEEMRSAAYREFTL